MYGFSRTTINRNCPPQSLTTTDGRIVGSDALIRFLANESGKLLAKSVFDKAAVDEWLDFLAMELDVSAIFFADPQLALKLAGGGKKKIDARNQKNALVILENALARFQQHLESRTFFVGQQMTIADVAIASTLAFVASKSKDGRSLITRQSHVHRWYQTCGHQSPHLAFLLGALGASSPAEGPESKESEGPAPAAAVAGGVSDISGAVELTKTLWKRGRTRLVDLFATPQKYIDQDVTVCGWVQTIRSGNKGKLYFIALNDGSCVNQLQLIADKGIEGFESISTCGGTGSSMKVSGKVVKSPAKGQPIEMICKKVTVLGTVNADEYPLPKGKIKLETLRTMAHLRPRTRIMGAMMRVRNQLAYATHEFFQSRGFLYVHTPIITAADCEGAGEMFTVTTLLDEKKSEKVADAKRLKNGAVDFSEDFFSKHAHLTVSGQLNVEPFCCSMSDVYTFGPTFRAEYSFTSRHLAEFWMIEPEIAFGDLEDDMNLAEDYLKHCVAAVLKRCSGDVDFFNQQKDSKGYKDNLEKVVATPFKRMTYTQVIELLTDHVAKGKVSFTEYDGKITWGMDLASAHEKYVTGVVNKSPTIVTDYPAEIKSFYMKLNEDKKTVRAMDVLVPGIGEIIGGSQRECDLKTLQQRCAELGMDTKELEFYLDLRRYGTVPHSGFGLGFERMVLLCTGLSNIRDVIPYPRYPKHADY